MQLFCPRPPLVNQLFHCGSEELLQIREVEQLMDHRVCFIFPCFIFSPGSLLRPYRLSAPGWQSNLFASYASHGTSVSTSSAAKHFKLCKFNEQQSNNVPKGMAFFSFPFVSTGAVILLSERCAPSSLAAVISHCMSFVYFVRAIISKSIGGVPASISKALHMSGYWEKNQIISTFVNKQGYFFPQLLLSQRKCQMKAQ